MDADDLNNLMVSVRDGLTSVDDAVVRFRAMPYERVGGYAHLDTHRAVRTGLPEVVYCPGKTPEQLVEIIIRLRKTSGRVLATRASLAQFDFVKERLSDAQFHDAAGLITVGEPPNTISPDRFVCVISAGTGDIPVAEEAALTLEWQGSRVVRMYDVGVAGIHRLLDQVRVLQQANVLVVIAGMEGALVSVVAGLVSRPVVAVPTSVGYGTSFGGVSALLTMLNSCAGGVAVVNIDNGFGAGCFAHRINAAASTVP